MSLLARRDKIDDGPVRHNWVYSGRAVIGRNCPSRPRLSLPARLRHLLGTGHHARAVVVEAGDQVEQVRAVLQLIIKIWDVRGWVGEQLAP